MTITVIALYKLFSFSLFEMDLVRGAQSSDRRQRREYAVSRGEAI